MGVEGFMAWLGTTGVIRNNKFSKELVSQVLVDFNFIIYEEVLAQGDNVTVNKIIEGLRIRFWKILESIDSKQYIFAMDGVPPFAKVSQQRQRRLESKPIYKDGKLVWDPLWITPFHPFMDKVYEMLSYEAANTKSRNLRRYFILDEKTSVTKWVKEIEGAIKDKDIKWLNSILRNPINDISELPLNILDIGKRKVEISSHLEPGEGEHKLMKLLDDVSRDDVVIIGNDSDMIILSLIKEKYNIFIQYYDRINNKHLYIKKSDILVFLKYYKIDYHNIWDFVLITMLVGNDFIEPTLQGLNTKVFLSQALEVYKRNPQIMTKIDNEGNVRIGLKNFATFLSNYINDKKINDNPTLTLNYETKIIRIYGRGIKGIDKDINYPMSYDWIGGVKWVLNYYKGINVSKEWSYKYSYGPSIRTLINLLQIINYKTETNPVDNTEFLDPVRHFICIIPYRGINYLRDDADYVYSELFDMFPTSYNRKKEGTRREQILMPPIPLQRIKNLKLLTDEIK